MNRLPPRQLGDINVITLVKGSERYVWVFDNLTAIGKSVGRFAGNPELDFTWYDAAIVLKQARETVEGRAE